MFDTEMRDVVGEGPDVGDRDGGVINKEKRIYSSPRDVVIIQCHVEKRTDIAGGSHGGDGLTGAHSVYRDSAKADEEIQCQSHHALGPCVGIIVEILLVFSSLAAGENIPKRSDGAEARKTLSAGWDSPKELEIPGEGGRMLKAQCFDKAGNVKAELNTPEEILVSDNRHYAAIINLRVFTFYGRKCKPIWVRKDVDQMAIAPNGKHVILSFAKAVDGDEYATDKWIEVLDSSGKLISRIAGPEGYGTGLGLAPSGKYAYIERVALWENNFHAADAAVAFRVGSSRYHYYKYGSRENSWYPSGPMAGGTRFSISDRGTFQIEDSGKILHEYAISE